MFTLFNRHELQENIFRQSSVDTDRENLNAREGQPVYTYSSHIVDTSLCSALTKYKRIYLDNHNTVRENLNDREGQPVYTYSSHLVDT